MACNVSTYESIKGLIIGYGISSQTLGILKQDFAREINSKRRLACINNLADLLDILERRDVINEANIMPLEDICYFLRDQILIDAVSNYKPEEEYELENEYALQNIQHEIVERRLVEERKKILNEQSKTKSQKIIKESIPAQVNLSCEKRNRVFDLIAQEIGKDWRCLGREIGIRGGEMHNLEEDYRLNSKEKIRKMLELFEKSKNMEPSEMFSCICAALVECRRPDLSRDIQKILTR